MLVGSCRARTRGRKIIVPEVLKARHHNWAELEQAIAALPGKKERGDALEVFAYFYLSFFSVEHEVEGEPEFPIFLGKPSFSREIREELGLAETDYGIDGVFRRRSGELTAVQSKFRSDRSSLSYRDLATFWAEADRAPYRLVFTNARSIIRDAKRRPGHLAVTVEQLLSLESGFFDALYAFAQSEGKVVEVPKKDPRPYQEVALNAIVSGLATEPRGKLTAACGIGKTLIALWAMERREDQTVLFIAPNLQLIRQTLREWAQQAGEPFRFLAVCSDLDAAHGLDEVVSAAEESEVPTTTDPEVITRFLTEVDGRRIVFSTYQSLPRVVEALGDAPGFQFDIAFFDEAHRTAGANLATGFTIGLNDKLLPVGARLFMTATERLFAPRAISRAEKSGVQLFSMDQPEIYGATFHSLSFSEAIEKKIISPYEVIVALISDAELKAATEAMALIRESGESTGETIEAPILLAALAIGRAVDDLGVEKLVSFHSTVAAARALTEKPILSYTSDRIQESAFHVNGSMSSGGRATTFEEFATASRALLTNVRVLVEGVDMPMIDGVCFATPKTSLIDIVQAVGRALRKPWGEDDQKVARVIVPVVVDPSKGEEAIEGDAFSGVFNVIQALRDQDAALADVIDSMNLQLARGKPFRRKEAGTVGGKVRILPVGEVNLAALAEAFELRVARVNARPGEQLEFAEPLGAGERGTDVERRIRTMADYTADPLNQSCIAPTMEKVPRLDAVVPSVDLRVNNNSVSHARKLGLIREVESRSYELTSLGALLWEGRCSFEQVMQNQMPLFEEPREDGLYPYRLVAQFIGELGSVRYWDLLFGLLGSEDVDLPDDERLARALERADAIADFGEALEVATDKTKVKLVDELNHLTGLHLGERDIWTDRTTLGNQFRYFGTQLALYDSIFEFPETRRFRDRVIRLADGSSGEALEKILVASGESLSEPYGEAIWLPELTGA